VRLEGIIIIVFVVDWKVTIKRNKKKGLVTPVSGSPEVDQGLTRRTLHS
jgi:hypothetical protein